MNRTLLYRDAQSGALGEFPEQMAAFHPQLILVEDEAIVDAPEGDAATAEPDGDAATSDPEADSAATTTGNAKKG
ncbi:hypothetical protein BKA24_001809 [Microbacterium marinum]|uniref:Uncharacterized protein n=1 Tax=Microbacterium marinum TaxID=421115 RepID=A0A7W7FJ61_9MICO|nr:hypothetical protein [Microbacterium marinum]MBB4667100.1 hypothetical protein [Microbacterium marinum]